MDLQKGDNSTIAISLGDLRHLDFFRRNSTSLIGWRRRLLLEKLISPFPACPMIFYRKVYRGADQSNSLQEQNQTLAEEATGSIMNGH